MLNLVKVGIVVIGIGSAILLAWHNNFFSRDKDRWDPIRLERDYLTRYKEKELIGNKYSYFLVGVENRENDSWWSVNGDREKCREFYLKKEEEVDIKEVWRLCSVVKEGPKSIKENGDVYRESSIGKLEENRLLSINTNEAIWFWKNIEFGNSEYSTLGEYFKNKYVSVRLGSITLKEVCSKVYLLGSSSEENREEPKVESVVKHCSLIGY